jgi:hypothetical protein
MRKYKQIKSYKKGGVATIDSNTPTGVSVGTQPYQDWEHRPIAAPYKTPVEKPDIDLRSLEQQYNDNISYLNSIPEKGLKEFSAAYNKRMKDMSWQDQLRLANERTEFPFNLATFPAAAVANLSQPSRYFKDRQGYAGFMGAAEAAVDVSSLTPIVGEYVAPVKNEIAGISRAMQQVKNIRKRMVPGVPLSAQEQNLLKNTRVVGSIYNGGAEESAKLQAILAKVDNLPDANLKAATGYTRQELQDRLALLQQEAPVKKASTSTIDLTRYRRRGSISDIAAEEQQAQEYLNNVASAPRPQYAQLNNTLAAPPAELVIDPNLTNNVRNFINNTSINTRRSSVAENLVNSFYGDNMKGFLPKTTTPDTKSLIHGLAKDATNNPAAQMLSAYKKVKDAPKGESFIPAHSLSADSYPMSLRLIEKAKKEGLGDIQYHGYNRLNNMGFPTRAELPKDLTVKEINQYIEGINKTAKQKIPYAYIEEDNIFAPTLTIKKNQYGGTINNNNMKTGGFYQKKGMFWDGTKMVKAKGSGTYSDGTYYQNGGQTPTAFWNLPNPTDNPGAAGMVDYGSMYSLPNRGLFQKQTAASEWEGFGNPANLIGNQQQQPVAQNYQTAGQPMQYATENKSSFYEGAGENNYSIDAIRQQSMGTGGLYKMGKPRYGSGGIHIDPSKKGTFSAAAEKRGQSVQGFASQVLANPGNYSEAMRKKAQFAHNAAGWKKQYGGMQYAVGGFKLSVPTSPEGETEIPAAAVSQNPQQPYNPAMNTGVTQPSKGAGTVQQNPVWRQGMTDQEAQANINNRPSTDVYMQQFQQPVQQRRPFGQGFSNFTNAAIAAGGIAAAFKSGREMKQFGIKNGMTNLNPTAGSRGQYNQQGQLMPQFQPPARYGKHGGRMPAPQYKTGGTYTVSAAEIKRLRDAGYDIEELG